MAQFREEATHWEGSLTAAAERSQVLAWAALSEWAHPGESPGQHWQKCPGALQVQHISIRGLHLQQAACSGLP